MRTAWEACSNRGIAEIKSFSSYGCRDYAVAEFLFRCIIACNSAYFPARIIAAAVLTLTVLSMLSLMNV